MVGSLRGKVSRPKLRGPEGDPGKGLRRCLNFSFTRNRGRGKWGGEGKGKGGNAFQGTRIDDGVHDQEEGGGEETR